MTVISGSLSLSLSLSICLSISLSLLLSGTKILTLRFITRERLLLEDAAI